MVQVAISIPDAQNVRVMNAVCKAYGYTPEDGLKPAFVKAKLAEHVRQLVVSVERSDAEREAMAAVATPTDVNVT